MGISLSGVGSGFDWQSVLEKLRQVEQNQFIKPLENQQKKQEDLLSAWNTVSTKLSDVLSAVQKMKYPTDFDVYTSSLTSSGSVDPERLFSVTVGSGAAAGRYDIQVINLAKAEKLQSTSVASDTDPTGWTGTITIEGQEVTLDGKSLREVRDEINSLNSGTGATGVTATILKVADADSRLILTSDHEGAAGMAFTDAPGDYFSTLQAGEDAVLSIDGISVTRSSNTISDAIPGVTLQLRGEDTAATVTLNIARDEEGITQKVQTFVDAYNSLMEYVNQQLTYKTGDQAAGGVLFGDVQLRSMKSGLQQSVLSQELFGYGITFSKEGTLDFDAEKFKTALSQDFSGTVAKFNETAQSLHTVLDGLTNTVDGTVTTKKKSIQEEIDTLDDRIQAQNDRIDADMERLKAQFLAMEKAMNTMNSQLSSLSQLFASLPATNS